jgi:hypothetical protein
LVNRSFLFNNTGVKIVSKMRFSARLL